MSKRAKQWMDKIRSGEEFSFSESIKEAGASLIDIGGRIWDGVAPTVNMGKSEIAAAMFSGHGYVMYGRTHEGGAQEQIQEEAKGMSEDQRDLGREM
jgi:hypothetical protein